MQLRGNLPVFSTLLSRLKKLEDLVHDAVAVFLPCIAHRASGDVVVLLPAQGFDDNAALRRVPRVAVLGRLLRLLLALLLGFLARVLAPLFVRVRFVVVGVLEFAPGVGVSFDARLVAVARATVVPGPRGSTARPRRRRTGTRTRPLARLGRRQFRGREKHDVERLGEDGFDRVSRERSSFRDEPAGQLAGSRGRGEGAVALESSEVGEVADGRQKLFVRRLVKFRLDPLGELFDEDGLERADAFPLEREVLEASRRARAFLECLEKKKTEQVIKKW